MLVTPAPVRSGAMVAKSVAASTKAAAKVAGPAKAAAKVTQRANKRAVSKTPRHDGNSHSAASSGPRKLAAETRVLLHPVFPPLAGRWESDQWGSPCTCPVAHRG